MVKRLSLGGDETAVQTATTPTAPDATVRGFAPAVAAAPAMPAFMNPTPVAASSVPALIQKPLTLEEIGALGSKAQGQLSAVTSRLAQDAKLSDMDEMGKLLANTMLAAKGYDPQNLFKGGLFGWMKAKKEQVSMRFDSVDGVVNKLVVEVDAKAQKMRTRSQELADMRTANEQYAEELVPQFTHLEAVADWMENNRPAVIDGDMQSAQYLNDWNTVITFARVRADNLKRAKEFAHQQSAIMGGMRTNAINLAQTLSDLKETAIPTMKTSFILYVQNIEQKNTADFADNLRGMTNEVAIKNAQQFGQNTEQITRSVNASNYELATLQANFTAITNALDTAAKITAEEAQRRKNELPQIEQLGRDLSARLAKPSA